MKLTLHRFYFTEASTIGRLFIDDNFECFTLEDCDREIQGEPVEKWKVHGETCIPKGEYKVITDFSQRFQKELPRILDVPGFQGIRMHSGNTSKDTEGCILVGKTYVKDSVNQSRLAFERIMDKIEDAYNRKEEITIEITS
jgi:hypothetical protein